MKKERMTGQFSWMDYFPALALSVASAFMLMFYAPLELYYNNVGEFWYSGAQLTPKMVPLAIFVALESAMFMILVQVIHKYLYRAAIFFYAVAFVATYIQGNFFVKGLPPMDGSVPIWEDYVGLRKYSIAIWVVVVALMAAGLYFLKWKGFRQLATWLPLAVSLMLGITLVTLVLTTDESIKKIDRDFTTEYEFDMSTDKNFVILLLDAVDEDVFAETLQENPQYAKALKDFTDYSNMMAGYPLTSRAVPFIFSANWFENDEDFYGYRLRSYVENDFISTLQEQGYTMGMYDNEAFNDPTMLAPFENVSELKTSFGPRFRDDLDLYKVQVQMTGFRYAPFDLKKYFNFNLADIGSLRHDAGLADGNESVKFDYANVQFTKDLIGKGITLREEPCYRYIHLDGAHTPFDTWIDNERIVIDNISYADEVESCAFMAKRYLEALKDAGVYDNSVIIIMADHGNSELKESDELARTRTHPILYIKGIGETHDAIQYNDAPLSHEDMAAALVKLAKTGSQEDLFPWKEGDERVRRYLSSLASSSFEVTEYIQTGHARDWENLVPTGVEYN